MAICFLRNYGSAQEMVQLLLEGYICGSLYNALMIKQKQTNKKNVFGTPSLASFSSIPAGDKLFKSPANKIILTFHLIVNVKFLA